MEIPTPEDMADSKKNRNLPPSGYLKAALKPDCPKCNAGWFNGVHCYDCGYEPFSTPKQK